MIPRVFDFSFIITFIDCTLVPWDPLSLLVVSLIPINGPHHWSILRWFSSMFDFNIFIHILEFILRLGWDGAQDPESCLIWLRLCGLICYSWLYTCLCYTYGCNHTMGLYIYDDPFISDGCVHTLDLRFTDDPSHLDGCAIPWIFSYSPYHLDGCIHIVDS